MIANNPRPIGLQSIPAILTAIAVLLFAAGATDLSGPIKLAEGALLRDTPRLAKASDREALSRILLSMNDEASSLARLEQQGVPTKVEIAAKEGEKNIAEVAAGSLRQTADQQADYTDTKLRQLEQQQYAICSNMGGSLSGSNCIFTCQSDRMDICQQKQASFDNQVADLRSQAEAAIRKAQAAEQQAIAAEQKRDDLKAQLSALTKAAGERDKRLVSFNGKVAEFYSRLKVAERLPLPIGTKGPAWRELLQQDGAIHGASSFRDDCMDGSRRCDDFRATPDGSIVVPATPLSNAPVQSSTYRQDFSATQTLANQFNQQLNEVRSAMEANAPDKEARIAEWAKTLSRLEAKRSGLINRPRIDNIPVPEPDPGSTAP